MNDCKECQREQYYPVLRYSSCVCMKGLRRRAYYLRVARQWAMYPRSPGCQRVLTA